MIHKIKKLFFTLGCLLLIPIYANVVSNIDVPYKINYTELFMFIFYIILTASSVWFLRRKKYKYVYSDIITAVLLGTVTITYTIPLSFIGFTAGICTTCIFLVSREMLKDDDFLWVRTDIKSNIALFGGITLIYFVIFITQYNVPFKIYPLIALKACAPAVSEELIFRVFLPVLLFKKLKLDNTFGNKTWLFFIITVPFAFLHCVDSLMMHDVPRVISRCYTSMINSLFSTFLIYKYGFVYGVYSHALSDFISMSILVN